MKTEVKNIETGRQERILQMGRDAYEFIMENLPSVLLVEKEKVAENGFQEVVVKKIVAIREKIDDLLKHESKYVRQTAWFAVLQVYFSKRADSQFELVELFEKMVADGLLEQTEENVPGVLMACGKKFVVPEKSHFSGRKTEQIVAIFQRFMSRFNQEQEQKTKAERLKQEGEIALEDLVIKRESGCCCIDLREVVSKSSGKVEVSGGTFIVEGDGEGRIFAVLGAAGDIGKGVDEIADAGVFVTTASLDYDYPPSMKRLENLGLGPDKAKKVQRLWYLLKRAMKVSGI